MHSSPINVNMDCPESLEALINKLDNSDGSNLGAIIKQMEIPLEDFEEYTCWDNEDYTRNCIHRTDEYELILLCWKKGAETAIHGHDGQKCWVYQVEGQLTEIRYEKVESGNLNEIHRMQLNLGRLTFMNEAMGYHKLINESDARAMTLHIYASPINSCKVFNAKKNGFESKELEYDTMNGVALTEGEKIG